MGVQTKLLKGNHAIADAAVAAGCRHFFGYPITPQSELMERMSHIMPAAGGVFLQSESEVAAINIVLGAAAAGARVMTASSGPGMDLMQEGLGNLHAHQLPMVIADITRAGPGNGALHPGQPDYNQAISGGRADTRNIVLAPWDVQEMYDLTIQAFDLADRYRNPVMVMAESLLGQVYESLDVYDVVPTVHEKKWAITGAKDRKRNLSIAHFPLVSVYNEFHRALQEKYARISDTEQRCKTYFLEDTPDVVVVAYGIVARNVYAAVKRLRNDKRKIGLFRPMTLWPFPSRELNKIIETVNPRLLVVEMSAGQMADSIKLLTRRHDFSVEPGQAMGDVPHIDEIIGWIEAA